MDAPLLVLERLRKTYTRGIFRREVTFQVEADLAFPGPAIVGMMGPNGAGKTTLFEMMTGSNVPSAGRVLCAGKDIHTVKYRERDRLAIHYHQSYQVRRFRRRVPSALLQSAGSDYPMVHLFDEPQFNTQDGYIGFMLDFFRALRAEGRLVFVCLHPTAHFHLELLNEICERYVFVAGGRASEAPSLDALRADERFRAYLGDLAD
ncbi:MAG: ATP-binding cassette domain-containing protein [Alphaproteobacteria bacterium]|nr:ATP-binding cassette domain-containing protein [Alphaproteobacteria bacterium]